MITPVLSSTETLIEAGYSGRVFTAADLGRVFAGTASARYALVNKALVKGELVRLKRGVYCMAEKFRPHALSTFYVASRVHPMSYVSFESALAFHRWIPERVHGVRSAACRGRAVAFDTPWGVLQLDRVAVRPYTCWRAIGRYETEGQPFLVADPLRALADLVYIEKTPWAGLDYLIDGLRIDPAELEGLTGEHFDSVQDTHRSRAVRDFLVTFRAELEP